MKNKSLYMPKFLKPNFTSFKFDFEGGKSSLNQETFKQELLLVHGKKNTIILLDGKVVYNSLPKEVEISQSRLHRFVADYKKRQTDDFVANENKTHLNSSLVLISKNRNKKLKINLVFGITTEIYHYFHLEAERDSSLEVFEKVVGRDNAKLNYILNIEARDNSNIVYNCFQDISTEKSQIFTQNIQTYRDANASFEYLNLSRSNTMNLSYGNLLGQGSSLNVSSCSFASGQTVFKSLMLLHHKAKNTTSNIDNVAVVNENASLEIDGVGKIEQGQSKSDAQQESKIISLNENAKMVANPQLIINEFDVKAGHAAGVGSLDKDQIFYLQSRGLSQTKAKELLLFALSDRFLSSYSASQKQEATSLIRKRIK